MAGNRPVGEKLQYIQGHTHARVGQPTAQTNPPITRQDKHPASRQSLTAVPKSTSKSTPKSMRNESNNAYRRSCDTNRGEKEREREREREGQERGRKGRVEVEKRSRGSMQGGRCADVGTGVSIHSNTPQPPQG